MRKAQIKRQTAETNVNVSINIDGSGQVDITTGQRLFDHMLASFAKHGLFDITLNATGDDVHHLVEDVGIALGQAFNQALSDKKGLSRMGEAAVPMDEALSSVFIDVSGRPYFFIDAEFSGNDMFGFPADMVRHFLEAFATESRITLHAHVNYGENDHHKCESLFKALGRALDHATWIDARRAGQSPSTKEFMG